MSSERRIQCMAIALLVGACCIAGAQAPVPPGGSSPTPGPVPATTPPATVVAHGEPPTTGEGAEETEPVKEELRDPFWPVGWTPNAQAVITSNATTGSVAETNVPPPVAAEKTRWGDALKLLQATMQKPLKTPKEFIILINGQVCRKGSTVSYALQPYMYSWEIVAVTAEGAALRQLKAVMTDEPPK